MFKSLEVLYFLIFGKLPNSKSIEVANGRIILIGTKSKYVPKQDISPILVEKFCVNFITNIKSKTSKSEAILRNRIEFIFPTNNTIEISKKSKEEQEFDLRIYTLKKRTAISSTSTIITLSGLNVLKISLPINIV